MSFKKLQILTEIFVILNSLKTPGDGAEMRPSYKGKKFKVVVTRVE